MSPAIDVQDLVKTYPGIRAVDGLSFTVRQGELFGLLGPNGAGKSSTLHVIEGLRSADSGQVTVLGFDVSRQPREIKKRIGVQLQSTSLLPDITAVSQLMLFGRLYGHQIRRSTAIKLLEQVGLAEKADALPDSLSGGQQQRLALALALVNDPEVIFLDEPTAGLDPQARQQLWQLVRQLQQQGRTIVLTTHYMEEAEALCHRVGIIDHGKLLALDTPGALINQLGGLSTMTTAVSLSIEPIKALPAVEQVQADGHRLRIQSRDVSQTSEALFQLARQQGKTLHDLHIQQPTLEDVFLSLTGRTIRE